MLNMLNESGLWDLLAIGLPTAGGIPVVRYRSGGDRPTEILRNM